MLAWREHPGAKQDWYDATFWYMDQDSEVAGRYVDAVGNSVDFIRQWPDIAPRVEAARTGIVVRSQNVVAFPYRIIYCVQENDIVVLAYAHDRRNPDYWVDRLDSI